jgi:hypothetical protein
MGRIEHTTQEGISTRGRGLGWRSCLRKGCGRRYQARHWRQRYCREPDCLRELRRWQAVKRQRKRRATPEGRHKHAQAERERRQRKKRLAPSPSEASARPRDRARGHAIKNVLRGRSAIGPAVLSPRDPLFAPPPRIAARRVAGTCVVCEIANVSGGLATRK